MANKPAELLSVGSDRSPARAREDYVKAIYQLGGGEPVRAAALARYLNVSRVSVSKAKRLLEAEGLLETKRTPSQPLHLSARGERLAVAMVRRHRVSRPSSTARCTYRSNGFMRRPNASST